MRHFYLLYVFFCIFPASAQLSITPSKTGSSYLYVKDLVLFVEKDINLEKNPNSKTAASIYLRKEAQLIQGEKSQNRNSGDGQISVFQEGTANAYNYNYWSLPVIDNFSEPGKLGNTFFEPVTQTESRRALITPALEGQAEPLRISSRWIYKFSGTEYVDWEYAGNNFDMELGEGFTMKGVNGRSLITVEGIENNPGNRQRYDFRGLPSDGEISLPVKKDHSRLVGNPYPSALHLKKFLSDNTATTGIAYFWDYSENLTSHDLKDYEGGYGAYSPGANAYAPAVFKNYNGAGETTGNTGETGGHYAREYCPIGQGFLVIGAENGQVLFKNSHREYVQENSATSQFRQPEIEIPLVRLNLSFDDLYTRQLLMAFREDATAGEDHAMDARSFNSLATDAAWLLDERAFLINVLPFDPRAKIPIFISAEKATQIEISTESLEKFNTEIYLFDAEEDTYHALKKSALDLELPPGDHQDRFFLCFKKEAEEFSPSFAPVASRDTAPEEVQIFYNRDQLQVEIISKENIEKVGLYNLKGKLIFSKKIYGNKLYHYFYTGNLREAVYIVKVKTHHNTVNKKLLLKK